MPVTLEKIVIPPSQSETLSVTRNIPMQRICSLFNEEEYNYIQETWSEWDDGSEAVCPKC